MIWILLYIIPCVALAKWQAGFIAHKVDWNKGVKVKHFYNGLMHAAAAVAAWFIFKDWKAPVMVLLIARLFFDTALSYFRGFPLDYVPTTPKSIVDKVEIKVFGRNGWLPKIIYGCLIVILLIC